METFKKRVLGNFVLAQHTPELEKICSGGASGSLLDEKVSNTMIHGIKIIRVGEEIYSNADSILDDGQIVSISVHGLTNQNIISWGDKKYYLIRVDHIKMVTGDIEYEELEKLQKELDSLK